MLKYATFVVLVLACGTTASAAVLDEELPTLSVQATTTGAEPGTAAAFTVKLSKAADSHTTVEFATGPADGADQATAGADYQPVTTTVRLQKGDTTAKVSVPVLDDPLDEARERFSATLSGVESKSGVRVDPAARTAVGLIDDNDDPPSAKVANAPDVTEGNPGGAGKASFAVSLSKKSGRDVRVAFGTRDGTAKAGEDYTARTGILTIPAGELNGTVAVDLVADTKAEPAESFSLVISRQDETATIGSPAQGSAKIVDDDQQGGGAPAASLSIADASGQEGTTASFRVTLAPAVARAVTVRWATADGTAKAGSDYTAGSGTLTFAPNETTKNVPVALLADQQADGGETFLVNLTAPDGATLGDGQAVGTITEQGASPPPAAALPTLSISDAFARESEGASFTVELSRAVTSRVSVTVSTSEGSAREGIDYLGRRATLEFAPGERTKAFVVTVLDDDIAELDETFSVGLGNPVNAELAKARGVATIERNDQAGVTGLQAPPPSNVLPVPPPAPAAPKKPGGKTVPVAQARWPRMALWPLTVKVDATGVAHMTVFCKPKSPVTCSGRVALQTLAKPKFELAAKSFVVRKGKRASLPLKLGPRGRTLVEQQGKVRARVIVLVRVGSVFWRVLPGVITLDASAGTASAPNRP